MRKFRFPQLPVSAFVLTLLLNACGGGGGSLSPPIGNVAGTWTITETSADSNVASCETTDVFDLEVTQSGNSITAVDTDGNTFSGTISGNQASWSGSYPEDGGTTTINSLTATVAPDCNSLSGTANWSWSDGGGGTCAGTTEFTGTRNPAGAC